jgi:hypothetical protein
MTTVQKPLNGHSSPSFFKSVIDDLTKIVIPSKRRERGISPKSSPQHKVADPIRIGVPSSDESQQQDELSSVNKVEPERVTSPRCQFTFSDGRQCRMQPSQLCAHHARKKEDHPSGPPPMPELEALCGDLTTATNINRALAQTFLLLAQGRISRRDAVAFGYLSQLLLQTVPAIRRESIDAFGSSVYDARLRSKLELTIPSGSSSRPAAKSGHPTRMAVPSEQRERGTSPQVPEVPKTPAAASAPTNLPHPSASVRPAAAPPAPVSPTSTSLPQPPAAAAIASPPPKLTMRPASSSRANNVSEGPLPRPVSRPPAVSSEPPAMRLPSPAPSPAPAAPERKPREDHFVAPPSRRPAQSEMPITRVDWYAPTSWSESRKPDPFPSRRDKLQRELRSMSNYRLRHLQHLNSRGF